jgi:hypothetical protein
MLAACACLPLADTDRASSNHLDAQILKPRESQKCLRARAAQMLEQEVLWQRLRQMCEEGAMVEALVESTRPAGLIVKVMGISGFVPGSHVQEVRGRMLRSLKQRLLPCTLHLGLCAGLLEIITRNRAGTLPSCMAN